ncbi:glycosyl hydrolase [Nocardioides sp. BP30]|uniref:glycosyl hydrolase n=1 Tax=Nocardioides sp. BP30 TaxID=3036374 RepID=UPI00246980A5|nr:glycosyl hydrolase [Nocardioides sp. BP30]WGL51858.1 glycosyl hydrolase [Nocardioides sp. BP30]
MSEQHAHHAQQDPSGIRRRALFGAAAAAAGVAVLAGAPAQAAAAGGVGRTSSARASGAEVLAGFRRPGKRTAAGFRWWWPNGDVTAAEVAREVDQVAAAGFGVLEVADVTHSLAARGITMDLQRFGWGTASWVAGVKAALAQGARRDVRIDITIGPSWPAAVPTITPDDDAACTELAHGQAQVAGGEVYDAAVPEPLVAPAGGSTVRHLEAVQAFLTVGAPVKGVQTLDPTTYVDLTDRVVDGRLTWTAPAGGTWLVLSYWRRGSAQEPEAGPHTDPRAYVVDHFSAAGSSAVIDFWNERILDREMRRLLRQAGGYLFEDSLEIESGATIWTPLMVHEFAERAGYDLLPYLPLVVEVKEKYVFAYDAVTTTRVRDDFNQVISDLYRDHHLLRIQAFARGLGMGLRVQPYGLQTDTVEHASLLDIPETESLGFKNLDDYRVEAGGRDMAGHTVMSCEAICYAGAAYQTTWDRALQTLNSVYVAGVNMAMIHGFAYATAPEVTWPGFAAFSPYYSNAVGYGDAWGPRTPQWRHIPDVADYLNRTQLVLQTGTPRYDVVFLRQKGWTSTGIGAPWATNNGIPIGWTHSFATPALLDLPRARVRRGRLAPDGPAYKVMIIGPDQFRGGECTIAEATAQRVLELARDGLPVIFLGDWTTAAPVGLAQPGETDRVRALVTRIQALPTTRTVALETDIPAALADLGITPDVRHDSSTAMTMHRVVGDTDLYYVANAKHAENRKLVRVTQDLWLTASRSDAVPYLLDAWTGATSPIALWERQGDQIRVSVDLLPGQSSVVALARPHGRTPSATAVSAGSLRVEGNALVLRASAAGTVSVTTGGRTRSVTIDRVRDPIALAAWDLAVEDWQPGASATETIRPVRRVHLDTLAPWSQIAGLEDVSGVGTYTVTVDLGRDWTGADGAVLDLGEVNDTFRVRVNGRRVPPCDVLDTAVDVGDLLHAGRNLIEVEVASTLINRLRTVTPAVYGVVPRQAYGLVGPVRLIPYTERTVR